MGFLGDDCEHHFLQVLPVGKELLGCLIVFKGLAACSEGKNAFASIYVQIQSSSFEKPDPERRHEQDGNEGSHFNWRRHRPLLYCCRNLLRALDVEDSLSAYVIEALSALSLGALSFCMERKK